MVVIRHAGGLGGMSLPEYPRLGTVYEPHRFAAESANTELFRRRTTPHAEGQKAIS